MDLPQLIGSPKQVHWAEAIRENTFKRLANYGPGTADKIAQVNDATWWIANTTTGAHPVLVTTYKDPAPYQLVGGPPKPAAPLPLEMLKLDCIVNGKKFTLEFAPDAVAKLAAALKNR